MCVCSYLFKDALTRAAGAHLPHPHVRALYICMYIYIYI